MKRSKKAGGGRPFGLDFVKKDDEIVDGDSVIILNEGMESEGNYGPQFVIAIRLADGEKKAITLNQVSENNMIEAYGDDSKTWVGKKAIVFIEKKKIGGERRIIAYLAAPGWERDEFGDFTRNGDQGAGKDDIPTVHLEEVPFPEEE